MRELRSRRLLCQHSDLANNDQLSLHYRYQEDGMAFCKLTIYFTRRTVTNKSHSVLSAVAYYLDKLWEALASALYPE